MGDHIDLTGLTVRAGDTVLVHDAELHLGAGGFVALVGPSGSGKSLTARSVLGLVDIEPGVVAANLRIVCDGNSHLPYAGVLGKGRRTRDRAFQQVRGSIVGYLPQDARGALDPLFRVRHQIEVSAALGGIDARPEPWLERAGFRVPSDVLDLWPHQLSGGMAQRVTIAQSLARGSRFLLADEPTSALDPTIQMSILRELRRLADTGIGVLLITHDLRILPDLADEVVVMDNGRMVETLQPQQLFDGSVETDTARRLIEATRKVSAGRLGSHP